MWISMRQLRLHWLSLGQLEWILYVSALVDSLKAVVAVKCMMWLWVHLVSVPQVLWILLLRQQARLWMKWVPHHW